MRSARALHLGLTLWLTACMAVVVPAHHHQHDHSTPTEASSQAPAKPGHKCHHADCGRNGAVDDSPAERHEHRDDCSICHFAAGIVHPHPVDVTVVRPQLLEVASAPEPATVVSRQIILPFDGRAPPAGA